MKTSTTGHKRWEAGLLIVGALVLFTFLVRHPTFRDPDAFFHAKMALLARDGVFPHQFSSLPYTTIANQFADQQFLYHIVLIPFVTLFLPTTGLKVAAVLFATLAITSFYFLTRSFFPSIAFATTLSLFASHIFLTRLLLGKAQPVAFVLFFFLCIAFVRRRSLVAFILSFLLVGVHGSWPIGFFIALLFLFGGARAPALAAIAGFTLGFVAHPAFPNQFSFFWDQTVRIALLGVSLRDVGSEWYPLLWQDIVIGAPITIILFLGALLFFFFALHTRRLTPRSLVFFILLLVVTLLTFRSRRVIEFVIPFTSLACASLCADGLGRISGAEFLKRLRILFREIFSRAWLRAPVLFFFCIALVVIAVQSIRRADATLAGGYPLTHLAGVAQFINTTLPNNAPIVLSDWSVFPQLFLFTTNAAFITGLDPRFFLFRDPVRFSAWEELRRGDGRAPSTILRDVLVAPYLLVLHDDSTLRERADADERLTRVYTDREATLFRQL